ncbi:DNA repair photolyase [Thermanaeromonas toyohensis ToBE]|uniref:DNA repair photolyase n=1 Tax=Thermanaeromonas toyohensis ToBE TaxID=698762 RepID=A0A1W1VWN9_9FIRM|nr:radical SAM protein [Thermanaeromonas toyohensis]SMB97670.1 DNA repair photolyase [Thermanaeromonas toyohensis ToBE]
MSKVALRTTYCRTALNRTGIPGYCYCLNPYFGCSHSCRYCYADTVLHFSAHAEKWGEFVAAKVNFPEVLRSELRRRRRPLGKIILGTVTDAYQPAEAEFGLTRASLEVFAERQPDIEIDLLTKSDLVVRDVDLLRKLKNCSVGFTVTTSDDTAACVLEPGAALPSARLRAAGRLVAQGINVWAFIAPILPGVSDAPGALEDLIATLKDTGIKEVFLDPLNPYPVSIERLRAAYQKRLPWALKYLEQYLSDPHRYLQILRERLRSLSRKYSYDLKLG